MQADGAAIDELSLAEREALAVLALRDQGTPGSMPQAVWLREAHRAGVGDTAGRALTAELFASMVASLRTHGAVHLPRPDAYVVADAWLAPTLADAASRGRLAALHARLAEAAWGGRDGSLGDVGDARLALARGDAGRFAEAMRRALGSRRQPDDDPAWVRVFGVQPSAAWLGVPSARQLQHCLRCALERGFVEARRPSAALLEAAARQTDLEIVTRHAVLLATLGEHDAARTRLHEVGTPHGKADALLHGHAVAFTALLRGDPIAARAQVATLGDLFRKGAPLPQLLPFLALLAITDEKADIATLGVAVEKRLRAPSDHAAALAALDQLVALRKGLEPSARPLVAQGSWINELFVGLLAHWRGMPRSTTADHVHTTLVNAGMRWPATQLAAIATGQEPTLARVWSPRAAWELALDALAPSGEPLPETDADGELVWELRPSAWDESLDVTARWVSPRARKGKEIGLARLLAGEVPIDPVDRPIVAALASASARRGRLALRQLALFVQHPRTRDAAGRPLEVQERQPRLVVDSTADGASLRLDPPHVDAHATTVLEEPERLTLVAHTPETVRIAQVLRGTELRVPHAGLARLTQLLDSLAENVPVQTQGALKRAEETGDPRLYVQLTHRSEGLFVRFRVFPIVGGAALRVGEPPEVLVVPAGQGLRTVRRNLRGELRALDALYTSCPSLHDFRPHDDELRADDLGVGLALLDELESLLESERREGRAERVVLQWRAGKQLQITRIKEPAKQVRFHLRNATRWLGVEGDVQLDDARILPMRQLLENMDRAHGRFVPIGEGEFMALSDELRQTLESLALARRLGHDGRLPLGVLPAVQNWTAGFDVQLAPSLRERAEAMARSDAAPPAPPSALHAALRDYQREGFEFLVRRADSGTGAILADDMGLGKTVQTLALLLSRGSLGPALVVAPTSVLRNWESEVRRFAPSLRVRRYGEGDRERCVQQASDGDVVLSSYGLLASDGAKLAARSWATLIYDEAHALKNPATQRFAAARTLRSEACVGLTGTPVENDLGELHTLLEVVSPGMLGDRESFLRLFAIPMARGERRPAAVLRQMIRPLILRRTKSQVLGELPPKIEMQRLVTASVDQRAFYEAIRQQVFAKAKETRKLGKNRPGQARIQLLAEITRLRRAAIDPRLVGGADAPPGSKLDMLLRLVTDLHAEGHRALVFSQFLEVLDMAEQCLQSAGFSFLRLDGGMNASQRAHVIDSFQHGRGDVLLASLKAGGVGVNLTAADYVIHLDPWWNPAVEDQATDRAHRFGQTRPVTVLRLITEHTIEEKVLGLHADKRRLYEDVVGEADGRGALDLDGLLELLA